jgi:GntR family transcriptional regulator
MNQVKQLENPFSASHKIDFKSNIPYYVQLTAHIREKIIKKIWNPGMQIPGEMELCEEYGVSRTVVRQSLRDLELDGLITRRKGKGTFVAEPKVNESFVQKLSGFYQDMVDRGIKSSTRVLHLRVISCPDKVAGYLQIPLETKVVDLLRLRYVEDEPIQMVNSFIPFDLNDRSLYEFLEFECGLFIARGRRYIEAVAANDVEAKLLNVDRGAPLVMLDSISYLEDGTSIEYYHAVHRGDRTRFEVELLRTRIQSQGRELDNAEIENLPHSDNFPR